MELRQQSRWRSNVFGPFLIATIPNTIATAPMTLNGLLYGMLFTKAEYKAAKEHTILAIPNILPILLRIN